MPRRTSRSLGRPFQLLALLLAVGCGRELPTAPVIEPGDPFTSLVTARTGLTSVSLLSAFHAADGTDWVGGSVGLVLSRPPGGDWSIERVASTDFVTGIWGDGAGDVYVVVGNALQRRNPPFWDPILIPAGDAVLLDIWGLDDQHAWIVGTGGTIIARAGTEWIRAQVPVSEEIWGIGGTAPDDLVAVGQNGVILESSDGGMSWAQVPSPTSNTLFAVAASPSGRMAAVGSGGTVLIRDGDTWEQSAVPTTQALFEVVSDGANGFLVAGNSGQLFRGDGLTWRAVPVAGARENLRALAGPSGQRVVAGWNGTILDESTGWGTSESGGRLYGLDVAPDGDAIAVGEGGVGYRRNGGAWHAIGIPSPASLYGIDGPHANDRLAVGDSGTVLHFDGAVWQQEPVGYTGLLRSVWYDGQRAMTVGASGTVLVREGGVWHTVASGTSQFLRRVAGSSWDRLWVAGDSGTLLRWDGSRFARINTQVDHNLRGIFEASSRDVWVVGDLGTILHFDGSSWTKEFPPVLNDIRAVHGVDGNLYIVGDQGLAYHLTDGEWTLMPTDQPGFWLDLGGSDELVAVGENGMIAEGAR